MNKKSTRNSTNHFGLYGSSDGQASAPSPNSSAVPNCHENRVVSWMLGRYLQARQLHEKFVICRYRIVYLASHPHDITKWAPLQPHPQACMKIANYSFKDELITTNAQESCLVSVQLPIIYAHHFWSFLIKWCPCCIGTSLWVDFISQRLPRGNFSKNLLPIRYAS